MKYDPDHAILKKETIMKKTNNPHPNRYSPDNSVSIGYQDFINSYEARKNCVQSLNLIDDTFFAAVMEDPIVCAYVIGKIIQKDDLIIKSCKVQYHISNLVSHSVTLDVIAEDSNGDLYNIEVQKSDNDHHPKRIRYYQSNVDSAFLKKGLHYEKLPETYFIFISKFDPFGLGDNFYEIERRIKGRKDIVTNGVHEIYLNTSVENTREITSLLQYFTDSDPDSDDFGPLSDKVRFYKKDSKGETVMCDKVQRLIDEASEEKDRIIEEQKKEMERQREEQKKEMERQKEEQQKKLEAEQKKSLAQAAEIAALKAQLAAMNGGAV